MAIDDKLLRKIKREYLATDTSYRKLADKYGVHYKALANIGKAEGWMSQKSQTKQRAVTKVIEAVGDDMADREIKLYRVADKLRDKIEELMRPDSLTGLAPKDIKSLTSSIKDLQDIYGVRSQLDRAEQQARIAKLRKEAEEDTVPPQVTVILGDKVEELSG